MVTHMKTMEATLPVLFVLAMIGCRPQQHERKPRMMLDSAASGDNVTIVRPKEAVGPVETITDLKGLPTIMQYDLDALQRTPSKEVVYVKPGEPARPSEARR
jgi:hypothetical protein